jgi:hypothetical protein
MLTRYFFIDVGALSLVKCQYSYEKTTALFIHFAWFQHRLHS